MKNLRKQGKIAEEIAVNILRNKGFKILEKNYTIQGGEIDIIAKYEREIVFVEVKSIRNENFISLEETITDKKREALKNACESWLKENEHSETGWRIDFLGLVINRSGSLKRVLHLEGGIY